MEIREIIADKDVLITRLDDEAALLNIKTGRYFGLNATGVRVWELLSEYSDMEEIFGILYEEYSVDKQVLRSDLDNLLAKLKAAGLVHLK